MSQFRSFLTIALPSLLAGGLLFGNVTSLAQADDGRAVAGFWPAAGAPVSTVPLPPAPPAPPLPPLPPAPPAPPAGISVSIHDGKVQIAGVKEMVVQQLANARAQLAHANLPPDVRAKLEKRLDKLQGKLEKRLAHLDVSNMDELGEKLGEMGNDIGEEMGELGEELGSNAEAWAEEFGKQFGKGFSVNVSSGDGSFHWDMGDDDSHGASPHPTPSPSPRPHPMAQADADDDNDDHDDDRDDDHDDEAALSQLGDASLTQAQRGELAKLRADTERAVAAAQADVAKLSANLRAQLANPAVTDAEVSRAVDAISAKEAEIRKARILAWVAARRALDAGQRAKIEGAAAAAHKRGH